jgi:hypothetical protein
MILYVQLNALMIMSIFVMQQQRELEAVKEWIASGKAWHAMRDHPMHFVPMLGTRNFMLLFFFSIKNFF